MLLRACPNELPSHSASTQVLCDVSTSNARPAYIGPLRGCCDPGSPAWRGWGGSRAGVQRRRGRQGAPAWGPRGRAEQARPGQAAGMPGGQGAGHRPPVGKVAKVIRYRDYWDRDCTTCCMLCTTARLCKAADDALTRTAAWGVGMPPFMAAAAAWLAARRCWRACMHAV